MIRGLSTKTSNVGSNSLLVDCCIFIGFFAAIVVHSRGIRSWVYTPFNRGRNAVEGNKTVENHHIFMGKNPV